MEQMEQMGGFDVTLGTLGHAFRGVLKLRRGASSAASSLAGGVGERFMAVHDEGVKRQLLCPTGAAVLDLTVLPPAVGLGCVLAELHARLRAYYPCRGASCP